MYEGRAGFAYLFWRAAVHERAAASGATSVSTEPAGAATGSKAARSARSGDKRRGSGGAGGSGGARGAGGEGGASARDALLDVAWQYAASARAAAAATEPRKLVPTLVCGRAGVLAVEAVVAHARGDTASRDRAVAALEALSEDVVAAGDALPNEILYGRAGYLNACLMVNGACVDAGVSVAALRSVATAIIRAGRRYAEEELCDTPLMWAWHGKEYYGGAHGVAGIVQVLLSLPAGTLDSTALRLLRETLDGVVSVARMPSGNYRSSPGNKKDRLLQWCHGAPGWAMALCVAARAFGDTRYLEEARRCGDAIWDRGLLLKGVGLCHGTSGNGLALLALYRATGEELWLHRARAFAAFAMWWEEAARAGRVEELADVPLSLYNGRAGMAVFLLAVRDPELAEWPGLPL